MKTKNILLAIILIGLSTNHIMGQKLVQKINNKVEVIFTNKLTSEDLTTIKNDLREIGITINYKKSVFDENNLLIEIECEVDCNDSYQGSFGMKFVNNKRKVGFYRDYNKDAKNPFYFGLIK